MSLIISARWNGSPWNTPRWGAARKPIVIPLPNPYAGPNIRRTWNGSPWNGARWGATRNSFVVLSAPAASLFAAIRAYLQSVSELSGLTDIYKNHPPRGLVEPYMVINSITGSDEVFNTNAYWRTGQYQFSIISSDDIVAETIGGAAYQALLPVNTSKYPPLRFLGGYEIVRWPMYRDRLIEQPMRTANNKNMWIYSFGYAIQTGHES